MHRFLRVFGGGVGADPIDEFGTIDKALSAHHHQDAAVEGGCPNLSNQRGERFEPLFVTGAEAYHRYGLPAYQRNDVLGRLADDIPSRPAEELFNQHHSEIVLLRGSRRENGEVTWAFEGLFSLEHRTQFADQLLESRHRDRHVGKRAEIGGPELADQTRYWSKEAEIDGIDRNASPADAVDQRSRGRDVFLDEQPGEL